MSEIFETLTLCEHLSSPSLSKEKLQTLRNLIAKLDPSSIPFSCNYVHTGINARALNTSTTIESDPWIIDSGGNDHMTKSSKHFSSYSHSSGKDRVRITDGSISSISGKALIQCTLFCHCHQFFMYLISLIIFCPLAK